MFTTNHKGNKMNKFKRMQQHRWLGGICSGSAYSMGMPVWIVRLFLALAFFYNPNIFGMSVFFIYILIALFAPKYDTDPADYKAVCE
jgi:phage shock protein PspC (stress-responsive transcriptional regulator)